MCSNEALLLPQLYRIVRIRSLSIINVIFLCGVAVSLFFSILFVFVPMGTTAIET